MSDDVDKLVSITQAAKMLGVHPLTLRNWAEKGQITYYRTPGGHRRFRQRDLSTFLAQMQQDHDSPEAILVTTTHQALRRAMTTPAPPPVVRPVWQRNLSEQQRSTMRSLGKQLLGMTLHYATGAEDDSNLDKGRELGRDYGRAVSDFGWSITEAVATFNFFRDSVIDSTFAAHHADTAQTELYQRLNVFFNEVLLSMIQTLEEESV